MASDIPKQKAIESKIIYIAKIIKHLMEEQLRDNDILNDKALHLVMQGLHQMCKMQLIRFVNDTYRPNSGAKIPWKLYFSQLALTLDQHSKENDIPIPGDSEKDGKSGVYEVDESDDEDYFYDEQDDYDDDVNEVGDGGCGHCGANHATEDCIKVINFSIMSVQSKFTPEKLKAIAKKQLAKQGKTSLEDLLQLGFRPKDRTRDRKAGSGDRRDSRNGRSNDRNSNGRPNDRRRNDGFRRRPNDRVREIEDVEVSPPPTEEEAKASEDVPKAAAVEEPIATPSPMPDTCNAVDHLDKEDTGDDDSSFSSEDSFDDELCLVSSGVFHISEIATVEDVEDGDEDSEDGASIASLVEETEKSLNILEQPQAEQPEFSTLTNPGYPLATVFQYKRTNRNQRGGIRPRYKLKSPPPTSWPLDVNRASDFPAMDGPLEKHPLTDQMLGNY
jgi:hypothetical protein